MNKSEYNLAVDQLRAILATQERDDVLSDIINNRDACLARFQPLFSIQAIPQLTEEQFRSFLLFENNKHWSGLNRKGHRACVDMAALRKALTLLLDESKPLAPRMNEVADTVPGMGKALITAIMLVSDPAKYGVWNGTSETSLKKLKVWPQFDRGSTFGDRYKQVNGVLLQLAKDLGVDLWTLDALHWRMLPEDEQEEEPIAPAESPLPNDSQRFGLERHLQDFLRDNWEKTTLGHEWAIYTEPGDTEAGYEYPTEIGRIDLLCKHRYKPIWRVIELKRAQSSDATVGQTLRYMAWVRRHLSEQGEDVEGLIISHEADTKLQYAISEIPKVKLLLYEVSFRLRTPAELPAAYNGNAAIDPAQ